ncbi:hypothetical protein H4R18_003118 [Coemansia javaensis]|uniref:Glycoside hydrolase 35 catalytic domain-containing protein n=1 Tax=Coemansia javaensis TaxID=2761396 RepID=A0A9W8LJ30_9FUNG|nr:hypothetical protein H4R18_003118 [Coemansia javaensis]
MPAVLLESGIVLVPLAGAALYIVVTSNALLVVFSAAAAALAAAVLRLRYHYSSGAYSDLAVRAQDPSSSSGSSSSEQAGGGHKFSEIVRDAQRHRYRDEVVRGGEALAAVATSERMRYDAEAFGAGLSFDHRCFYVRGRAAWILAADFDYWRLPGAEDGDSEAAWRRALQQYRALGFSAVRIRFHWGFHSPRPGAYDFAGRRDVGRLLGVCAELGLLVIAALGPFVGGDVQGGGFPPWLLQQRGVRVRHVWRAGLKAWDDRFAAAAGEWLDRIAAVVAGHEVVTRSARGRGCVALVQLENGLAARGALGLPLALHDETRLLARMARERLVRVPLATNNLRWPADFASPAARLWARAEQRLRAWRVIAPPFRPDIAGFTAHGDLAAAPLDLDAVARITRADNAPMAALELRCAGAFSGQIEAALSQGLAVLSLPGFFDLGARGTLAGPQRPPGAPPAVPASGALSADARAARLVLHAARALEPQLAASDATSARPWISRAARPSVRAVAVDGLPPAAVCVRRQWETGAGRPAGAGAPGVDDSAQLGIVAFVDGRGRPQDASPELPVLFTLAGAPLLHKAGSFVLTATLGARRRGIFAANVLVGAPGAPLALVAATKELYARVRLGPAAEAWICAEEAAQAGQLLFHGECRVSGHADLELVDVDHAAGHRFSFVAPRPGPGVATVAAPGGGPTVHLVLVSQRALDTLVVGYGPYDGEHAAAVFAAWGVDGLAPAAPGTIDLLPVGASEGAAGQAIAISHTQPCPGSAALEPLDAPAEAAYSGHPFVWAFSAPAAGAARPIAAVSGFERRTTSWDALPWKLLPTRADLETMDEINLMTWQRDLGMFAFHATDLGYNGTHVLYRCQLRLKPRNLTAPTIRLQLNVRHRCTVWVNGVNMSGHQTLHALAAPPGTAAAYIEALRHPGAAEGPDRWGGTTTYDVTRAMRLSDPDAEEGALNEVHILVESRGLGAQADGNNDARTPRGLLAAYWHGFNFVGEDHDDSEIHDHDHDSRTEQMRTKWEICGVDVTALADVYGSSGIPDEQAQTGWIPAMEQPLASPGWSTRLQLSPDAGVQWWRWRLPAPAAAAGSDAPVCLNISGEATVCVWINGVLVGRHDPGAGPSLVLLRGGLAGQAAQPLGDEVRLMLHGWADDAAAGTTPSTIPVEVSLVGSQ